MELWHDEMEGRGNPKEDGEKLDGSDQVICETDKVEKGRSGISLLFVLFSSSVFFFFFNESGVSQKSPEIESVI